MPSFLHSGDLGDVIYSLPVVKKLTGATGSTYYLCDRPKLTRSMTPARFEALRALLIAQPYIAAVEWHKGEKVTYDFTRFRGCHDPKRTLTEAQAAHVCPQKAPDLKSPWLVAPKPESHGRPVFARSARYQNPEWDFIWPEIMQMYPNALFLGLRDEHEDFCQRFGDVEFRSTVNFADVANIIAGSSIFVGNQSSPYAIAEGLKHTTIQETNKRIRDCIFPARPNAQHILTLRDWEKQRGQVTRDLILMLGVCPLDVYLGLELARLIADIEEVPRQDVEFIINYRRDTNPHAIRDIVNALKDKFPRTIAIKSRRRGVGWPNGCNDLWQEGMDSVWARVRDRKTEAEAVLTFEPDCIPLRPDWINVLKAEWRRAKATGKLCVGHAHNDPVTHINGNAIFATNLLKLYPHMGDSEARTGWDVYAGNKLVRIALDTNAILQKYRIKNISHGEVEAIRKNGVIPALFHGIKSQDGINAVRHMMKEGYFFERLTDASDRSDLPSHELIFSPDATYLSAEPQTTTGEPSKDTHEDAGGVSGVSGAELATGEGMPALEREPSGGDEGLSGGSERTATSGGEDAARGGDEGRNGGGDEAASGVERGATESGLPSGDATGAAFGVGRSREVPSADAGDNSVHHEAAGLESGFDERPAESVRVQRGKASRKKVGGKRAHPRG